MFMGDVMLSVLTEEWSDMSSKALSLEVIQLTEMQRLLRETYEVLQFYNKFGFVPKEVLKLLFEMDHYIYFSTIMRDEITNDSFPYYQAVDLVVKAIEAAFFQEEQEYKYPELKVYNLLTEDTRIFNLEKDCLTELMYD